MNVLAIVFVHVFLINDAWDNGVALTPPLAWSSWYSVTRGLSCDSPENQLSEEAVLKTADALVSSGVAALGFQTLIIDDCWQNKSRDSEGFLHADPEVFPRGMGWLAKQLQQRSLALGLYTTPGQFSCMKRPASEGHEAQDVDLWIKQWGARYFKYCVCNTTHARRQVAYSQMQQLLADTKLPVVYEIDPSIEMPMTSMDRVGNVAGAHDDVSDSYDSWVGAISDFEAWEVYSGNHTRKGHWPLIDIVQVGRGGQSFEEYRSQVSMYAMLCSPLILGVDFRNSSWVSSALPLITNVDVLRIHQDSLGIHAHEVTGPNEPAGVEVWARPLSDGSVAVAFWNAHEDGPIDVTIDINLVAAPLKAMSWHVRDVWARSNHADTAGPWVEHGIAPHSLRLLRFAASSLAPLYT